ncbi:MAG: chaperone modulator CbpM [Burkholderiaceae bacterium]
MNKQPGSMSPIDLPLEEPELTLAQVCQACAVSEELLIAMVTEGVIEPRGPAPAQWRFSLTTIWRVRRALRLERDLGVNTAGAALALDLLDELEQLRSQLRRMGH